MENRKRPIAKRIWFSEDEWSKVEAKMGQAGVINFSAFAAEMLLRGQVKTYDFSHLKELNAYMGRMAFWFRRLLDRTRRAVMSW